MESGEIITVKENGTRTDKTQIRIMAAANKEQRILEELKNRFDIHIEVEALTTDQEKQILRMISSDWNRTQDQTTEEFLKKYMLYARQFVAKFPEDREFLIDHILREQESGSLQGKRIRKAKSIYPITLAIAKLQLKKEVDIQCLIEAIKLLS